MPTGSLPCEFEVFSVTGCDLRIDKPSIDVQVDLDRVRRVGWSPQPTARHAMIDGVEVALVSVFEVMVAPYRPKVRATSPEFYASKLSRSTVRLAGVSRLKIQGLDGSIPAWTGSV